MNLPRRITGVTLIILGALSLLISMFFTLQVWRIRLPITNGISSALDVTTSTPAEPVELPDESIE